MSDPTHDIHRISLNLANQIKKELADGMAVHQDEIAKSVKDEFLAGASAKISRQLSEVASSEVIDNISNKYSAQKDIERWAEGFIYFTRWFMVPAYIFVGIALAFVATYIAGDTWVLASKVLGIFANKFGINWLATAFPHEPGYEIAVTILKILDVLMLASLMVMVIIGGYENTISRIEKSDQSGPTWVGNLDIGKLKTKVATAIVLISSIHLLKQFMSINFKTPADFDWNLFWVVIIHVVFVLSAIGLAIIDKMSTKDTDH